MPEITETFYAQNRALWRKWLQDNGHVKKEIWLYIFKKGTTTPSVNYDDAVEEALCFGWVDGIMKGVDAEKYAQRFSPRRPKSHWTPANIEKYKKLLQQRLVTPAGEKAFFEKA